MQQMSTKATSNETDREREGGKEREEEITSDINKTSADKREEGDQGIRNMEAGTMCIPSRMPNVPQMGPDNKNTLQITRIAFTLIVGGN